MTTTTRYFVQIKNGRNGWRDISHQPSEPITVQVPAKGFVTPEPAHEIIAKRVESYGYASSDYRVVERTTATTVSEVVVARPVVDPGTLGAHVVDRDGDLWVRADGDAWFCLSGFAESGASRTAYSWARLQNHAPLKVQP